MKKRYTNVCLQDDNEEELELEIEQIPDDVLHQLLRFVHSLRPEQASPDEDYEPPAQASGRKGNAGAGASQKPKKNKPMNKFEQEQQIKQLRDQLQAFDQPGGGADQAEDGKFHYYNMEGCYLRTFANWKIVRKAESSSDDESASESEEE